jgi:Domain of unknown function (DUF1905)
MGSLSFNTTLVERGPGVAIALDDAQVEAVGEGAKRFPVAATVNSYTWRSTAVRMRGEFLLGLSKEVRGNAGVDAGDEVAVQLELGLAERELDVAPALTEAIAGDDEARAAYERLAYTHRKEFAR